MINNLTKFVKKFEKNHPEYAGELYLQESGTHLFARNMDQFVIESIDAIDFNVMSKKFRMWNYELMSMLYNSERDIFSFNVLKNRDKYTDYTDEEELSKALIKFLNWKNVTFKNYKKKLRIKAIEEL